ncbi:MAG: IS630 family transposase [Streptosporangiaceae bacterium]
MPTVSVDPAERATLLNWKRRSDTMVLIRMKAEAVLYASMGVSSYIIASTVDRSLRTVSDWLRDWNASRLCSVVTGHAGNENAAKLTRDQKAELKEVLESPPSEAGVPADFWDVPALEDVVKAKFDVAYESDSSYQLLMRFLGMSFKLPDPFDKRRDETKITTRMEEIKEQVRGLLAEGHEVYTVDEVRVEHEAETRRMWLPRGQRTKIHVDRKKAAQSFFGALSLTEKKMKIYPVTGQQNAQQSILMLARLQRETPGKKIGVVLDNASFHHAKELTKLFAPGQALEQITPIFLPPYAPDHNPTEHVWNAGKGHIANLQRDTPEETFSAFMLYITGREFDYDFEHLPILKS